jgi:RNA polymerase sigma-B factor
VSIADGSPAAKRRTDQRNHRRNAPAFDELTDHELLEWFREYRRNGDRALRNRLIEAHRWLAVVCARQLGNRGEPLDDLVQVAMIGVLKAVERFDPEYGVAFKTFASPTVMGELRRHYRDATWAMRVPRRLQELHLEVNDAIERLTHKMGRAPSVDDLAGYLRTPVEEIVDAISAGANYRSVPLVPVNDDLDDDDDGGPDGPTLGFTDPGYEAVVDRAAVARLITMLPRRERSIVALRFFHSLTQSEIAERIGISQVHVSRVLRASLERLRANGQSAS